MRGELLASDRLYAALLYLYPRHFRAAFGQPMRLAFRDACRAAYQQNGAGGLLALWLPTLLDLLKSALAERAQRGEITMSKSKLIGLAGPLSIVVGALWLVAAAGDFASQTGLFSEEALLAIFALPFFVSFVPLLFALIGTRLRFHPVAGGLGKTGLALSLAGCAGVLASLPANVLLNMVAPEAGWQLWLSYAAVVCLLSIRIGYLLFGLDALRYTLLRRWNLLPLLLGATVVLSFGFEWFGVPAFIPAPWAAPALHFGLTGACWVLLGLALTDPRQDPQPAAAL